MFERFVEWRAKEALVAAAVLAGFLSTATAAPTLESRYTRLDRCREIGHGDVDRGEDWVAHRCEGYGSIPVWLRYMDSARLGIGFGSRPNISGIFSWRREDAWPLEWRGEVAKGAFRPFAVILRVRDAGDAPGSSLVVYRLGADGTSCIVGSALTSNAEARRIADAARLRPACEPERLLR
jgi:hypothetical protein